MSVNSTDFFYSAHNKLCVGLNFFRICNTILVLSTLKNGDRGMIKQASRILVFAVTILVGTNLIFADEGMWLLSNLPLNELPSDQWTEQVQKSSARLPNCSASLVSSDGLIMTNGHCAQEAVQALSTPQNNLYENGFYARTLLAEKKTSLNLKVLISVEDRGVQKQGLVCEEVILYQGGQYNNYCYKVYDDIRLVFSSEKNTWFFGGDADNFEYPRFAMDVAFLRAYENDKPAQTSNHFKWSKSGASEDELIFVSGHPGSTERMLTSAALETERDIKAPFILDLIRRREITTQQFMLRGKEQTRIAKSDLFSWQNGRKLYTGKIRGLQDLDLTDSKKIYEKKVTDDAKNKPHLTKKLEDGRLMVADAQTAIREIYSKVVLLLARHGFDSRLFKYAQSLVSGNQQFAESVLEERNNEPPLNLEYEEAKLRDSLTHFTEVFGVNNLATQDLLMRYHERPSDVASLLISSTRLADFNEHKLIVQEFIKSGSLPFGNGDLIVGLVRDIQVKHAPQYEKAWHDALEKERQGYAKISEVLFELYGTDIYPDATFTLRLSFGTVSGYEENGRQIAPFTTIGQAFAHSAEFDNTGDHQLPLSWYKARRLLRSATPLNFTSNLDITGGNSGSPVFNKELEIVGLVFDGNIHSLVSDYDYNYSPKSRAISVHSSGILEMLQKVYKADRLVKELTR